MSREEFRALKAKAQARKTKRQSKARELWGRVSRKGLIKRLDQIVSLWIRSKLARLGIVLCQFCQFRGKPAQPITQAFHFKSRVSYATRWLVENLWASCGACNIAFEHDVHFIGRVIEWYKDKFGPDKWEWIDAKSRKGVKLSDADLQEKIREFTEGLNAN